jgi:A/G-specific adenine glycosylase
MVAKQIVPLLIDWFADQARDLPWRRTRDPYATWVSEIMLQQTQVKTVIGYWERWMLRLPTIESLAEAESDLIHKLWEGLGYYTRVRNMQRAATIIVAEHGGRFPTDFDQVLALPGIGRYTAGAICSIAFNQPRPILDGNVMRVLCRIEAIKGDPRDKQVHPRLWDLAESLVREAARIEKTKPRTAKAARHSPLLLCSCLNQSLMELGALVCTPRLPQCEICPVAQWCQARRVGLQHALPQIAPRSLVTRRRFVAFVVQRRGKLLLRQRPAGTVNAHLWEFPNIEVATDEAEPLAACRKALGITPADAVHLRTIQHSITRYRITLDVFRIPGASLAQGRVKADRWFNESEARQLAFASAHKKILVGLSSRA